MPTPKIHILGLGNLGRLFAHSLANKPNPPPITLLFHRPTLLQEWQAVSQTIHLTTNNLANFSGTYSISETNPSSHSNQPETQDPIENLIVTTKTIHTLDAIRVVKHRLGKDSTILFTQNGIGTVEEVTKLLFPDENERPGLLAAITSHGVFSQGPFRSVHAGFGDISIGHVYPRGTEEEQRACFFHGVADPNPNPREEEKRKAARCLLDQVVGSPVLAATEVLPAELWRLQLEKLVMNAMINPLTVLFNCKNGNLFQHPPVLRLMRVLLEEASSLIEVLPGILESGDEERFSVERLKEKVLRVAEKTALNTSSMLQDVRAGRETEIEYINGWIVRKRKDLDARSPYHEMVIDMVKTGKQLAVADVDILLANKS